MPNEESVKATRATIEIGFFIVDGFMLPDSSYRMSLFQVAELVELATRNTSDFIRSKAFKTLMGKCFTVSISKISGGTRSEAKVELGIASGSQCLLDISKRWGRQRLIKSALQSAGVRSYA